MPPPPGTVLGSVAIGGLVTLGSVAILSGLDGALFTSLNSAILGVLIIVLLRRAPNANP